MIGKLQMSNENKKMQLKTNKKQNGGITLIALVVTIVVLLILAGITITMVLGEDGILSQAKLAAEKTKEAEEQQEKDLQDLVGMINDTVNGKDPENLQDAVSSKKLFSHTTGYDESGKKIDENSEEKAVPAITIPAGFKIIEGDLNSIDNGVVISDEAGNEFVWVPCADGEYKAHTYTGDHSKDNQKNIADTEGGWNTYQYKAYSDWTDDGTNETSVKKYGGFYIARYEAGIPSSMTDVYVSPNNPTANAYADANKKNTSAYAPVSKKGAQAWNYICQINAKEAARKMYNGNSSVISQLVDGTAWDRTVEWITENNTDIVKDSTNYGNYANNGTIESSDGIKYKGFEVENTLWAAFLWQVDITDSQHPINKGFCPPKNYQYGKFTAGYSDPWTGENKTDFNLLEQEDTGKTYRYRYYVEMATGASEQTKLNNIYDLAGNMIEFTTETGYHNTENGPQYVAIRGGCFDYLGSDWHFSMRRRRH